MTTKKTNTQNVMSLSRRLSRGVCLTGLLAGALFTTHAAADEITLNYAFFAPAQKA